MEGSRLAGSKDLSAQLQASHFFLHPSVSYSVKHRPSPSGNRRSILKRVP